MLSPVLFGVVAAILLIVSGHGIVGNLVVSDAAAGGLVVGLLPYGIAKCGSRPRLMYRDSETADWTLAVSASQLALERALPDGSRARVEIDRADAGDLDADYAASHGTISSAGRAIDKPSSITVDDRHVATDPAAASETLLSLPFSHPGGPPMSVLTMGWLPFQRLQGFWHPPGAQPQRPVA